MIWATVSSQSCFCWLYRASPSLAAKNIVSLIFGIDHPLMSTCRVFSCVVGRGCLLWPVCSLHRTLLAFALLHFGLLGQTCLLLQVSLAFLLLYSSPQWCPCSRLFPRGQTVLGQPQCGRISHGRKLSWSPLLSLPGIRRVNVMLFSQWQPTVEWLFTGETEVLFPGCGVCLQILWLIPRSLLALRLEVYESMVVEGVRAGGGVFTVVGWILSHSAVVLADNYPCKNHSVTIFGAIEALAKDSRMRGQDNAWQTLHVGRGKGQRWAPGPSRGFTGSVGTPPFVGSLRVSGLPRPSWILRVSWAPHPSRGLTGSVSPPHPS